MEDVEAFLKQFLYKNSLAIHKMRSRYRYDFHFKKSFVFRL